MQLPQPVSVQTVQRRDLRITVQAIGTITALNTAVVRAQVSGVLQSLHFKEGEQVAQGQQLAQIDPRSFEASLRQAEGTLARDQAQLDNARMDLARYRELLRQDAVAKQQLDTQEALVRQLDGTVRADQGAMQNARLQLSYTRVTAPISGRVGLKQADLGNIVQTSDANGIVSITQTRPIALLFAVPSEHLAALSAQLNAHKALTVEAWERGGGKKPLAVGTVATMDNAIDTSTDTIKVKALFPNQDDALFPNQSVNVVLELGQLPQALAVPQAAVLRGAQGFYVYVVGADGTVHVRNVQPGPSDGGWTGVQGALQPGERVVVDGTDRLREGAKVEVVAPATSPATPSALQPGNATTGKGHRRTQSMASSGSTSGQRNATSAP